MADDSTPQQQQPPPQYDLQSLLGQIPQVPQAPQPDQTPVHQSWLSKLGEVLGGGMPSAMATMSPADRQWAGLNALTDFSGALMRASGNVHPGQTWMSNVGEAMEGAQRGYLGTEGMAASMLAAKQQYSQEQYKDQIERLKTVLPLLKLQVGAGVPNTLVGSGTAPAPSGGGPAPGSIAGAIAPFVASNLPKDITPAEDQMVRTVYGEARGEPLVGQQGVASVIKNRMQAGNQNAQDVIFTPNAFQPWNDPKTRQTLEQLSPSDPQYQAILNKAVRPVMSGDAKDPTGGATNFYSPTALDAQHLPVPSWAANQQPSQVIGGHQFYKLPYAPQTAAGGGGPAAPYKLAGSPVAPSSAPPAPGGDPGAPAATPGAPLTFEQFQAQHPVNVAVPDLSALISARDQAKSQYDLAVKGISGDPNKSLSDYNTAAKAVTDAQATATAKSVDTQRQLYNDELTRQQTAALKAQELAQQVAENEKQRQAQAAIETQKGQQAIDLAKVTAGQTWHQKLQEQAATDAQENTIKPMAAASQKAHQMNLGLSQMLPVLQDLPPGGGPLGVVLDAHPDLAPLFNTAGILTDRQANAVRLINGLVASISSEMKPTGLGALREYEWDAFKAQLPSLLSTSEGQLKAVALIMNMNNRIQQEGSWMGSYFSRKVPDETSQTPGAMVPAHNLESDDPKESVQQRMDRELGPIVPSYTGAPTGSGQAQWEQSLPPGKPYYKTYAVPDPKNPGQPLRDRAGNIVTTKSLEVRPWQ
jgi:N-acetylmuramoyl-L-alanine amidase